MHRFLLLSFVVLVSCGTPQFQEEKRQCSATWMQKIPPVYETRLVNVTDYEDVPTGRTTCVQNGNVTTCEQEMMTIAVPRVEARQVDIKSDERNPQIEACTVQACVAKYGNSECKVPK